MAGGTETKRDNWTIERLEHDEDSDSRRVIMVGSDGTLVTNVEALSDDDHNLDGENALITAAVQYFRIDADTVKPARMDAVTHSIQTVDYAHHEIHAGSSFTCSYAQTVADNGDKTIIAFKTPAGTKYLHLTASASATGVADACIIEAPTITDNTGATLPVYNRRRVGTPTATTVIDTSQNPDVAGQATFFTEATQGNVTGGTEIANIPLGATGGGPVKSVGGLSRGQQEWILKPNTLYAFVVESLADGANIHWVELDWYEHTDKD